MAAAKKQRRRKPPAGKRRVWVKAHCRKRPEAAWRRRERINRDMPF